MKKPGIHGRHKESCDTSQTLRKLYYRTAMKKAGIQGRHEKNLFVQGRYEEICETEQT